MNIQNYHPYRWRVFWAVFTVTLVVSLMGAAAVYMMLSARALHNTQLDLQDIATKTARLIPAAEHEQLQVPDDMKTAAYTQIESLLKSVMAGNPKIDDIYTLRPAGGIHSWTFVVAGKDDFDENHNGILEDNELKPTLGEVYNSADQPDLERGLQGPSYDHAVTYDKWGAWLSGYAPVRDLSGQVVAVLGVDYSAAIVTSQRQAVLRTMLWAALGLIPLIALAAWLLSNRTQRPFLMLARAMDRVLHGEPGYKITVTHNKEEETLARLFNSMTHVLRDAARQEVAKKQKNQKATGLTGGHEG